MNKAIKRVLIVFVIFVILTAGLFLLIKNRPADEDNDIQSDPPAQSTEIPKLPDVTPEPTPEPTKEPVKEFKVDDKVKFKFDSNDYIDGDNVTEGLSDYERMSMMLIDTRDYSNGFIVLPTDNTVPTGMMDGAILSCAHNSFSVYVSEKNPESYTWHDRRRDLLANNGFLRYGYSEGVYVERGSLLSLGEGLDDWEYLREFGFSEDPTINDYHQVVADCSGECSFGELNYLCLYNIDQETFVAYASVVCDGGRVLEFQVSGDVMSLCWSYIIEVTNSGIRLIE